MRFRFPSIALAVAAAVPTFANAVEFSYNSFATAAYAQTDKDEARVGYVGQPNGVDSSGSFEIDSKFGVQVTARFNDMVSATVQGVAYADLTGDWEPRLGAIVKLQYDHIRADRGTGMLNNATADFDGNVNMISLSLDCIF
jgi:hypothetical protein